MRNIDELISDYQRGIYTFGEVITAIMVEGASRRPEELVQVMPKSFLKGVAEVVRSLPSTATADDVVVFKSSREHAEAWFNGAVNWRHFFAQQESLSS
ncbi:hypothetical protein VL04_06925 [Chromobacterium violaceum]|uniref:hypothetical protein n=1 Tax=Chromobacterium violaceum TaxID=536 RepID=UPI000653FF04|nr:hypothetical protein [Chromobacterium violaceum]KMN48022.1 hypothetical protein VK93_18235 [Chromobacterium violaceum]KMN86404.1 hypothetical protein VL02_09145 [Chromobacterium violaceum]KMN91022.1 hypothetical protein VL04_06925 [Chromobacterium violaceum]KMO05619.1 hypothetical protein VL16_01860 [Chromobacterium violaceum]